MRVLDIWLGTLTCRKSSKCALKNVFAQFCSLALHLETSFHAWRPSVVPRHAALFAVELCTEEQKWAIGLHCQRQ